MAHKKIKILIGEKKEPKLNHFVICIGDSQTNDYNSYARKLSLPKIVMSKDGRRTALMRRLLEKYLQNPKRTATHAVIWGGTNDIAGAASGHASRAKKAKNNIESMINSLKKHNSSIKIALITLPKCLYNRWVPTQNTARVWSSIEKAI